MDFRPTLSDRPAVAFQKKKSSNPSWYFVHSQKMDKGSIDVTFWTISYIDHFMQQRDSIALQTALHPLYLYNRLQEDG